MVPWKDEFEVIYCACGCGGELLRWNRYGVEKKYIIGHSKRGKTNKRKYSPITPEQKLETKLCECGCGTEILKYDKQYRERRFVNGHQMRGENHGMLGKKHSDEVKQFYSESRKGHKISEVNREMTRQRNVENWQNPEYREKMLEILSNNAAITMKKFLNNRTNGLPNKTELKLQEYLNEFYPDQWEFVGNGSFIIGNKNPDFKHREKNWLVELYGNYWHKNDDPEKRIDYFKKYDYETVVIWESELKHKIEVKKLLEKTFNKNLKI